MAAITTVMLLALLHFWLFKPMVLFPLIIAVGVLCSRPTFIGERHPWLGPVILMGCSVVALLMARGRQGSAPLWPITLVALSGVWSLIHKVLVPDSEPNIGTTALTFLVPLLAFYFIAQQRDLLGRVVECLVAFVSVAAVLTAVAFLAGFLIGWGRLQVGTVPLGYASFDQGLLLPGALIYGPTGGGSVPRFLGLGREPGMGAIFIGWAFFAMPKHWRWGWVLKATLIVALAATQSTTGIGLFGVILGIYLLWGQRQFNPFVAVVGLAGGAYVAWIAVTDPTFGFLSKLESTGTSFADRNLATRAGIEAFMNYPFTATTDVPLSSINLIATTAVTGAPWVVLMFFLLFAPVGRGMRLDRRNPALYSSALILVTMMTSQPLAGSVAVLVLTLMNYYSIDGFTAGPPPVRELRHLGTNGAATLPRTGRPKIETAPPHVSQLNR